MRLTKLSAALFALIAVLAFFALSLQAQNTNDSSADRSATVPRSSAEKYHAHATQGGVSVGAELLTSKEVSKEFAADVNHCCLVVQVAVYPGQDESLNLSLDNFTLIADGTGTPIRPQSATVLSAKLGKNNRLNDGPTTAANAGVGYESATYTDPATGQKEHAHNVTASVGTSVDGGPAATAEPDSEAIRRELSDKGLPEAKVTTPVSGYLYFALPKQKKDAKYRLEFIVKDDVLSLDLP